MMDSLDKPLSDEELDWLDDFLLNRFDGDDGRDDIDEGIFDVSTLDGYFTAIVSGPEIIPPSVWLPELDGDHASTWQSEEQFQQVFTLLIRHMNSISQWLMTDAAGFHPLFTQHEDDGEIVTSVDEWCEGYLRGIRLNPHQWNLDDDEMKSALSSILIFGSELGNPLRESASDDEIEHLQHKIIPAVTSIYQYWLRRRGEEPSASATFRYEGPRPGRNDPCPCGSGRKYKKCCLQ